MRGANTLGLGVAVCALLLLGRAAWALAAPPQAAAQPQSRTIRLASLFGESDEEKAARQQHEDSQDATIQDLGERVRDLEGSLRRLTGQNELLVHRIDELNGKLDRQQKDFDYRLCAMAAQQLDAGPAEPGGLSLPCTPGAGSQGGASPAAGPGGPQLGNPPGVLGTLPANVANAPQTSSTEPQFDAAMNLLASARYDEARAAFRSFADANPKDPLAPQAVYWIGDIAYVQKDYPGAAHAFAEEIKKYPTSTRGADSMLKLGKSLIAMGQKKEGCTALGALRSKYPDASKTIVSEATSTRKAICR